MGEAKFTPGPWQRSGVRIKLGAEDCLKVGPDGFPIAFLPIGRMPREQAGAIADANLIAAAPELLEALEGLVALLPDPELDEDAVQRRYVVAARVAISKATGAAS